MTTDTYTQTKGIRLLGSIVEQVGPIFSIEEVRPLAHNQGLTPGDLRWLLSALARSGWVARIKRGVYAIRSPLFMEELHPFALASALVEPMAISHWSALTHHGLTTQIPPMAQASTPKKVVTPEMRDGVRFPDVIPARSRVSARTILLDVGEVKESIQLENKVTIEINGVKKPDCVAEMITRSNFKITDPLLIRGVELLSYAEGEEEGSGSICVIQLTLDIRTS